MVIVVLLVVGLALVGAGSSAATPEKARVKGREVTEFIRNYWQTPIPVQGEAPRRFSPIEASLDPEMCGVCHRQQYEDWRTSLHSKSMGPGVLGQAVDLVRTEPETALLCYSCHATLSEQQEKVRAAGSGALTDNRAFDTKLQGLGLTCAGCHVRNHQRFGPPKRGGSRQSPQPRDRLPHNGVTRTVAFERAEFCRGCHQFSGDGYALNGKLLENTYNEWRDGPSARAGISCQQCHMPDRRHLWRGIHDPEMVRQAVAVALRVERRAARPGQVVEATLTITNRGAGHMFPTYVTPQVFVRVELADPAGESVAGTLEERTIGRGVSLDLAQELYDTRIPPRGSFTFRYTRKAEREGLRLRATVTVYPDYHYVAVFKSVIPSSGTKGRPLLEQALKNAEESRFEIFRTEEPVS